MFRKLFRIMFRKSIYKYFEKIFRKTFRKLFLKKLFRKICRKMFRKNVSKIFHTVYLLIYFSYLLPPSALSGLYWGFPPHSAETSFILFRSETSLTFMYVGMLQLQLQDVPLLYGLPAAAMLTVQSSGLIRNQWLLPGIARVLTH